MPERLIFGTPAAESFVETADAVPQLAGDGEHAGLRFCVAQPDPLTGVRIGERVPSGEDGGGGRFVQLHNGVERGHQLPGDPRGVHGLVELAGRNPGVGVGDDRHIPVAVGGLVERFGPVERAVTMLADQDGFALPDMLFQVGPDAVAGTAVGPVGDEDDGSHGTRCPSVARYCRAPLRSRASR